MRTLLNRSTASYGSGARVLVIGAGVSGLTTGLCARQRGYEVVVVADRFAPEITSVVAGALWEWPPAVCGHHRDERSLERARAWCRRSYEAFFALACDPGTGVFVRPGWRRRRMRGSRSAPATAPAPSVASSPL